MSFTIKYDKDGNPIANPEQLQEISHQADETLQTETQEQEIESIEQDSSDDNLVQETYQKISEQPNNFKELRDRAERAERDREMYSQMLRDIEAKNSRVTLPEEDNDINLAPDDIAEGKHLSKVQREIKKLKDELNQYKQQSATQTAESRLKSQYPDFDKVVSKENIESLKYAYPEIAQTLNASTDLYSTAVSAYTLIKKLGIYSDVSYAQDIERVKQNASKPKTLTSISPQQGDSPLSRANAFASGLTDDLKKQLHKEMIEALKNR